MSMAYHELPAELFDALAAGHGGPEAMESLKRAQHSKHAVLLRGVVLAAEAAGHGERALARQGYDLLSVAEGHDPGAVRSVIRHPSVGAWAYRTVTALGDGPALAGATPGGLAAVAAAAAIRVGTPAEIRVPVTDGVVMLPSVGVAGPFEADEAVVRYAEGQAGVTAAGLRVVIPADHRDDAADWRPLRPVLTHPFELLLDDVDPFRMPTAPDLATAADPGQWSSVFRAAWALLQRHHPAVAAETAALVRVVVPLARPRHGLVSSSSPETFGAIALSEPSEASTLASTIAHEVQHIKLSALLDLVGLTGPDDRCRYYAPWREDPRPISGLLQGAYAYLGVSEFWRRQRQLDPELEAHVEFARWHEAVARVTGMLRSSGKLTARGEDFVRGMSATIDGWRGEEIPEAARQRAREENERHLARWQARNGPVPVA